MARLPGPVSQPLADFLLCADLPFADAAPATSASRAACW
jgi:hypothetical protein